MMRGKAVTVLGVGLLAAGCATAALAGAPNMKMTTDIPTNVMTPDKMETRLGTLRMFFHE